MNAPPKADLDCIFFRTPPDDANIVFYGLPASISFEQFVELVMEHGPVHNVRLFHNGGEECNGAYVQYYYWSHAERAIQYLNGALIGGRFWQVCRRRRESPPEPRLLSRDQCLDLANHFLGFAGWRNSIVYLRRETDGDDGPGEGPVNKSQYNSAVYEACIELEFPRANGVLTCRGYGRSDGLVDSPDTSSQKKVALSLALCDAFSQIVLIIRSGKVVDIRRLFNGDEEDDTMRAGTEDTYFAGWSDTFKVVDTVFEHPDEEDAVSSGENVAIS